VRAACYALSMRNVRSVTAWLAGLAFCGAFAVGPDARAQQAQPAQSAVLPIVAPIIGPPQVVWLSPGDASGAAGNAGHAPSFVLDPIRLALFGDAVPLGSSDPACSGSPEATGTATAATGGFASQRTAAFQLVPHLTLVGFSRGGCGLDAAAGGAVVFAMPIRKDVWFAASAGILTLPHAGPMGSPVVNRHFRADVVFAQPDGRSLSVGVSKRGLTFGGVL
jgi:hypothetical protein